MIKNTWLVLIILSLALFLRLPQLNDSFWLDEAAQALESSRPLNQQLNISEDFQPPLLHYLSYFAIQAGKPFGWQRSEWWLRTWGALIPGLVTIFFTIKIGQNLTQTAQTSLPMKKKIIIRFKFWKNFFGKPSAKLNLAGLLAGLLLAISSLHIFYSQELRPYSLPAMWAVLAWWLMINKRWVGLTVVTALGLYSSYLYPFFIIGQLSYLIYSSPLKWKLRLTQAGIKSLAGGIGLFLPLIPIFIRQLQIGGIVQTALPGWSEAVSIPQIKALPLVIGKFLFGVIDLNVTLPFIALSGIFLFLFLNLWLNNYLKQSLESKIWLQILIFWLIIPLLSAWLVSFIVPVIRPKRLLLLLPGFYLSISGLITTSHTKLKYAFLVLLVSVNIYGTFAYLNQRQLQREDWRGLISALENRYLEPSNQVPTTAAVFSFPGPFPPWTWYAQPDFATISTGTLSVHQLENFNNFLAGAKQYQTLLVFDYLQDLTDPHRLLLTKLEEEGFAQHELFAYPGIGFVRELKASQL